MLSLYLNATQQRLFVYDNNTVVKNYLVSTGKNGMGEQYGSEKTPRGWHVIRAKIGEKCPLNTVFIRRRPTGEIYSPTLAKANPGRDWMLTRIFWLSGLEKGKNRLGNVDTMRRYIYIHGTPNEVKLGVPGSRGCIRMRNTDIIELFEMIPVGTRLLIEAS